MQSFPDTIHQSLSGIDCRENRCDLCLCLCSLPLLATSAFCTSSSITPSTQDQGTWRSLASNTCSGTCHRFTCAWTCWAWYLLAVMQLPSHCRGVPSIQNYHFVCLTSPTASPERHVASAPQAAALAASSAPWQKIVQLSKHSRSASSVAPLSCSCLAVSPTSAPRLS